MLLSKIILLTLLFPVFGIFLILFLPIKETRLLKIIALDFSCFSFLGFIYIWVYFDKCTPKFQFIYKI